MTLAELNAIRRVRPHCSSVQTEATKTSTDDLKGLHCYKRSTGFLLDFPPPCGKEICGRFEGFRQCKFEAIDETLGLLLILM